MLMNHNELIPGSDLSPVVQEIRSVLENARCNVARQVNSELLNTYWNIGRIICEYEQTLPERADYGKQTLKALAKELTNAFGKGFSRANLYNMRLFYLSYQKIQTVSGIFHKPDTADAYSADWSGRNPCQMHWSVP